MSPINPFSTAREFSPIHSSPKSPINRTKSFDVGHAKLEELSELSFNLHRASKVLLKEKIIMLGEEGSFTISIRDAVLQIMRQLPEGLKQGGL